VQHGPQVLAKNKQFLSLLFSCIHILYLLMFFLSFCTANLLYILYMRNNRRTNCFPENMSYDDDDLELQHLKISSVDIISLIRIYILYDYSRFVFDIWNARVFILQIFGKRCLETIKMQTTKLKCIYSTISIFTDYIKMYVYTFALYVHLTYIVYIYA
jgi:hypothetical protein